MPWRPSLTNFLFGEMVMTVEGWSSGWSAMSTLPDAIFKRLRRHRDQDWIRVRAISLICVNEAQKRWSEPPAY